MTTMSTHARRRAAGSGSRVPPALVGAGVAFVAFVALLVAVAAGALGRGSADTRLVTAAHEAVRAHSLLLSGSRMLTFLGAPVVVDVAAAVAAAALWVARERRAALYVVIVRLAAQGIESAVKVLVARARPMFADPVAHATGYSFPSGHATGAASLYLPLAAVAFLLWSKRPIARLLLAVAVVVCLVVAATRVLLGVHYPSDVVGGFALGGGLTAAAAPMLRQRTTPE